MIPQDILTAAYVIIWLTSMIALWQVPDWNKPEHDMTDRLTWLVLCLGGSALLTEGLAVLCTNLIRITR